MNYPTTCPECGADFTKPDAMEWRGERRVYRSGALNPDGTEADADDGWSEGEVEWDLLIYCLACDAEMGPVEA